MLLAPCGMWMALPTQARALQGFGDANRQALVDIPPSLPSLNPSLLPSSLLPFLPSFSSFLKHLHFFLPPFFPSFPLSLLVGGWWAGGGWWVCRGWVGGRGVGGGQWVVTCVPQPSTQNPLLLFISLSHFSDYLSLTAIPSRMHRISFDLRS